MRAELRRFIRDERGQTTMEYILLLAAIVSAFLIAVAVLRPLLKRLADFTTQLIESRIFTRESFHKFPLGK